MTAIEKLESLKNNEVFAKEISAAATAEGIQVIFAKYDIDFTMEETQQMLDEVKRGYTDELSAEDLDSVNGGNPFIIVIVAATIILMVAYYIMVRNRR